MLVDVCLAFISDDRSHLWHCGNIIVCSWWWNCNIYTLVKKTKFVALWTSTGKGIRSMTVDLSSNKQTEWYPFEIHQAPIAWHNHFYNLNDKYHLMSGICSYIILASSECFLALGRVRLASTECFYWVPWSILCFITGLTRLMTQSLLNFILVQLELSTRYSKQSMKKCTMKVGTKKVVPTTYFAIKCSMRQILSSIQETQQPRHVYM
jgi:hypothetical protein